MEGEDCPDAREDPVDHRQGQRSQKLESKHRKYVQIGDGHCHIVSRTCPVFGLGFIVGHLRVSFGKSIIGSCIYNECCSNVDLLNQAPLIQQLLQKLSEMCFELFLRRRRFGEVTNINVYGGNNTIYAHLCDEDESFYSFLTVKNDLAVPIHIELRTPGGLYYLGDRYIPAGDDDDSRLLKGTYDLHIISSESKEVLSSITITDDVEISASGVLKGAATVATDPTIILKSGDGVSVFLSEEGIEGYAKVLLGDKADKVEVALDRLRAPAPAAKAEGRPANIGAERPV